MTLADLLAALRWWAALVVIGLAAAPVCLYLFRDLGERGYAFSKMVGVLIVSYFFWLLGSLGFLANNMGGILFGLVTLIAVSAWAFLRQKQEMMAWIAGQRSQILTTELVFAIVFALWVWVRAQNPAIAATEKPMEFAFLNAIGRSPDFPPLDPWLSGFAISYYYFGYVMTSIIARLASVPEPIAFNLGIAWLVAASAVAAFGLVYNLVVVQNGRRAAMTLGLVAAAALPIAGNLEIGLEILHGNGAGSSAFWEWLDVRDLSGPAAIEQPPRYETTSWWWWRSSRVIHEYHLSGRPEENLEPIAEFPGFSFVLGDMHPHVLALPFAFVSMGIALVWWLRDANGDASASDETWDLQDWREKLRWLGKVMGPGRWAFTALVLGGLSFLNTWDVLIHLLVILGAFLLNRWRRHGWHGRILVQTLVVALLLTVPAVLLYLPFYIGFRSQAGPPFLLPMLMRPTRLAHLLIIFGMPLVSITLLLATLGVRQRLRYWKIGLTAAVVLVGLLILLMVLLGLIVASSADGVDRVTGLAKDLGLELPQRGESQIDLGWGLAATLAILPRALQARLAAPGVTLLLSGMIALTLMVCIQLLDKRQSEVPTRSAPESTPTALPFVLLLIATGGLLILVPEYVYLRDNFGMRLNTVFKFYYQAWAMFGVAALCGLAYLWQSPAHGRNRVIAVLATAGYALALAVGLMFPYYAIQSRAAEYRGPVGAETRLPATLDGLTQLSRLSPDEHEAITWLRGNAEGSPVIVEAVGGQYSSYGRVSASTGLPTILGWPGHELQWRGNSNPEPGLRDPAVRQIYSPGNWENTVALLNRYKVEYVIVGGLERSSYGAQVGEKFEANLPIAFANNSVTIFRWQPG